MNKTLRYLNYFTQGRLAQPTFSEKEPRPRTYRCWLLSQTLYKPPQCSSESDSKWIEMGSEMKTKERKEEGTGMSSRRNQKSSERNEEKQGAWRRERAEVKGWCIETGEKRCQGREEESLDPSLDGRQMRPQTRWRRDRSKELRWGEVGTNTNYLLTETEPGRPLLFSHSVSVKETFSSTSSHHWNLYKLFSATTFPCWPLSSCFNLSSHFKPALLALFLLSEYSPIQEDVT